MVRSVHFVRDQKDTNRSRVRTEFEFAGGKYIKINCRRALFGINMAEYTAELGVEATISEPEQEAAQQGNESSHLVQTSSKVQTLSTVA